MDEKTDGEGDSLLTTSSGVPSKYSQILQVIILIAGSCCFLFLLLSAFVYYNAKTTSNAATARPLKVLEKPLVILISSDGFRWGYQWKVPTPNIDRLWKNGTQAFPGMIPVYPTVTFPNHYSIVTGLYPAWHGIINNEFSDPEPNSSDSFTIKNLDAKWWLGEPLWETVKNNGLGAAAYFWPGSEVVKGNWSCPPSFCPKYNGSVPYEERVDAVLGYLDLPDTPSFIGLYFEEPDATGHRFGPDAPQIDAAINRVDSAIGRLLRGLEKRNIIDDVNIIMVGDHGMVGTCDEKLIALQDLGPWVHINESWVDSATPVLGVRPPEDVDVRSVVEKMRTGLSSGKVKNGEFLRVFVREELPERLHYSGSDRIQPIIGMVSEGYEVELKRSGRMECAGSHGYDNEFLSMRTVFFAHGPRFQKGRVVESFENVEIYNFITTILGIEGAPNNGSQSFANNVLLRQA